MNSAWPTESQNGSDVLDPVREDHHDSGIGNHVVGHVSVFALEDDDGLLARDALRHVVVVVAAVELSRFERGETSWPLAFVRVLDQVLDNVTWAAGLDQTAPNHALQHRIYTFVYIIFSNSNKFSNYGLIRILFEFSKVRNCNDSFLF